MAVGREDCQGQAGRPGQVGRPGGQSRGRAGAAASAYSRLFVLFKIQILKRELGSLPAPGQVEGGADVTVPQ